MLGSKREASGTSSLESCFLEKKDDCSEAWITKDRGRERHVAVDGSEFNGCEVSSSMDENKVDNVCLERKMVVRKEKKSKGKSGSEQWELETRKWDKKQERKDEEEE